MAGGSWWQGFLAGKRSVEGGGNRGEGHFQRKLREQNEKRDVAARGDSVMGPVFEPHLREHFARKQYESQRSWWDFIHDEFINDGGRKLKGSRRY